MVKYHWYTEQIGNRDLIDPDTNAWNVGHM